MQFLNSFSVFFYHMLYTLNRYYRIDVFIFMIS